jgi:nitroreductase
MHIPKMIRDRRSIRAFSDRELSDEDAELLVEAACCAPSAGNLQPWAFIIVRDLETKKKLVQAANGQSFIAEASVVFVVCAILERSASRYGSRGRELYCLQDTAAAVQNLMLTAVANGLGSCWVGAFDERKAAWAVGLPEGVRPVAIIAVGYPAVSPSPRRRRHLSNVIHKDKW